MITEQSEFSCVLVHLPKSIKQKISAWSSKNIDDDELYESPGFGREEDSHITVIYGLHTDSPSIAKEIARKTDRFTIELSGMSLFIDNPAFDVLKLEVKSPELHELNQLFRKKIDYTSRYDKYKPHVTIAYLKKSKGWKYEGNEQFEGTLFQPEELVFSDKNRTQTRCPLMP